MSSSDSSALAVTITIGISRVRGPTRSSRQTSRPALTGSIRSSTTRSGSRSGACPRAARLAGPGAEPPAGPRAGLDRQHQVEHDQVGEPQLRLPEAVLAVVGDQDLEA